MYSNNVGSYTLKSNIDADINNKTYQTVSFDEKTGDIIVKLVNTKNRDERVKLDISDNFQLTGKADIVVLTGDEEEAENSIENPENVSPYEAQINAANDMYVSVPKMSFTVLRIHTVQPNQELLKMTQLKTGNSHIEYSAEYNGKIPADIYIVLYTEDGKLYKILKNQLQGEFTVDNTKKYTLKLPAWKRDTMIPIQNAVIYNLNAYSPDSEEVTNGQ